MAKKYYTHLDLNQLELRNATIQNLSSNPLTAVEGQIYYNTVSNKVMVYDGIEWVPLGASQVETDPVFVASPAYGISSNDISGWNAKTKVQIVRW